MTRLHFTWPLLAALAAAPALGGCKKSSASEQPAATEQAISVTTTAVTEVTVPQTLRLSGTLRGERESDLAANAAGRVIATSVERGEAVKPGQVLARLDIRAASLTAAEARAQAASSRAQEDIAKKECERYEQLHQKGAVSELEYERMVAQCRTLPLSVEAAAARAQLAAQNVGDGVIRAPFAGVVTDRYVEVGQYLRQDSRVVSLASVDPLRLELFVPEADVARVQPDAEVAFRVAAFPERRFSGKVRFISGALRPATRDLVVEAVVPNADRALKPGMFADVEIEVGTQKLPSVPRSAVLTQDGISRAFFVVGGRLEERVLSLGPESGDRVSVRRGATLGEPVVSTADAKLVNGQRVR